MNIQLSEAVERFTLITSDLKDEDLEKPWSWGSYDSEGIRFAFFRTYEELQELAVKLELERASQGIPITSTQRIIGEYHLAFRDLEAVLLNVTKETENLPLSEGEWSIRETIAHMLAADFGFYVTIRFAIENHRGDSEKPEKITEQVWEEFLGLDEKGYDSLMEGSCQSLREYHVSHHQRIMSDFADITEQELEVGSRFWENEEMDLRFRLHRFDSHLRQHTIQIEKCLENLGHKPSEARRLLRQIYRALAECENRRIGMPEVGEALRWDVASRIAERSEEINTILQSG